MSKLLNNLPIENLNEDNDYLGIIDKGQIIKTFLESNTDEFKDIKMFSLYGEWGSGKSTLMKYLQKELKGDFNTFFFEAWQFESDSNLSLSLLEYLLRNSQDITEEALGEMYNTASRLFKGFVKSTKVTFPVGLANVSIDGTKMVEVNKKKPKSFLELKDEFKIKFRKWEDNKTSRKPNKFNIVFIDDLDRCEPENVLNLLSALKLFFTYGEKTIFLCGIDKKAVNEAVKTKYGDIVKANEYLEKVFDISFSMPYNNDLLKLVSQYFVSKQIDSFEGNLNENIAHFFQEIKFTNPRRLKKILNKYTILEGLKSTFNDESPYKELIPNIAVKGEGNFFETIFTLYFLILNDFHKELLDDFYNLERKKSIYKELTTENSSRIYSMEMKFLAYPFSKIKTNLSTRTNNLSNNTIGYLVKSFSPINPILIESYNAFMDRKYFETQFLVSKKEIDYYFTLYLMSKLDFMKNSNNLSDFNFLKFRDMINKLL